MVPLECDEEWKKQIKGNVDDAVWLKNFDAFLDTGA